MNKLQEATMIKELDRFSKRNPGATVLALTKGIQGTCVREDNAALLRAYANRGFEIRFSMIDGNLI